MRHELAAESAKLSKVGPEIRVESALTIDTLPEALVQLSAMPSDIQRVSFERSGQLDSGAVVFLLECQKKTAGHRLILVKVPSRLQGLLDLYGVDCLFEQQA